MMAFVETETHDQVMVIRLNRPDRLNALSTVVREGMAEAFTAFRDSDSLEIAILTGTGRGFCVGEDMKESLERGERVDLAALAAELGYADQAHFCRDFAAEVGESPLAYARQG